MFPFLAKYFYFNPQVRVQDGTKTISSCQAIGVRALGLCIFRILSNFEQSLSLINGVKNHFTFLCQRLN